MRLVSDPGWILTKNSILQKVIAMMGELAGEYREIWGEHFGDGAGATARTPEGTEAIGSGGIGPVGVPNQGAAFSPKVSRGENYRGLPWVMLDFPRVFGREDVFAIRTMCWWGHGFNVTLHLKGVYLRAYLPVILARRVELAAAGFHVGIHEDEWRHEHTGEVYTPLGGATIDDGAFSGHGFLKLSAAVGLDRWAEAPELLARLFGTLVGVLRASGL